MVGQQLFSGSGTAAELLSVLRLVFFIVINYEIGRYLILLVRKKYPTISNTFKRVAASYLLTVLTTFCLITFSTIAVRFFVDKPFSFLSETLVNLLQSFWIAILIIAPYEVLYFYSIVLRVESEKEQLQKITIESQLHALQAQVQPHFLFNSLNTLSALTIKDSQKAEAFVMELSSVYRYLLHNSQHRLTTLREELDFIHSFLHLLETRFEDGLFYNIEVPPEYLSYQIPPLSLQVLIENAVKHNIFSEKDPLQLSIYVENEKLVVANTLRKKPKPAASAGFGLSNIIARYALLQKEEVEIIEDHAMFTVQLPLLKPGYESVYS